MLPAIDNIFQLKHVNNYCDKLITQININTRNYIVFALLNFTVLYTVNSEEFNKKKKLILILNNLFGNYQVQLFNMEQIVPHSKHYCLLKLQRSRLITKIFHISRIPLKQSFNLKIQNKFKQQFSRVKSC